eukprot:m.92822 g.92822  ORF g.92822 m.92822 type:complete len:59 (+) comp12079_c0_seq2:2630-2806(+)
MCSRAEERSSSAPTACTVEAGAMETSPLWAVVRLATAFIGDIARVDVWSGAAQPTVTL